MPKEYVTGFQDAVELCIKEVNKAKTKEAASKKLQEILELVIESKLENVRMELLLIKS
jgi:predicted RNase H-like HicB family nuclease